MQNEATTTRTWKADLTILLYLEGVLGIVRFLQFLVLRAVEAGDASSVTLVLGALLVIPAILLRLWQCYHILRVFIAAGDAIDTWIDRA